MPPLADFILPAKQYYDVALPYHNWQHALDVMESAKDIIASAIKNAIPINEQVIMVAAAWHDSGYAQDHRALGFESKEHYSAHLVSVFLTASVVDGNFIKQVEAAILGTIHNAERRSIEDLILHRADIANIGGDYQTYYLKNSQLYQEKINTGTTICWSDWQQGGTELVKELISEARRELPRLKESTTSKSGFISNAQRNTRQILDETGPMVATTHG